VVKLLHRVFFPAAPVGEKNDLIEHSARQGLSNRMQFFIRFRCWFGWSLQSSYVQRPQKKTTRETLKETLLKPNPTSFDGLHE
jgi:hypothetical protein